LSALFIALAVGGGFLLGLRVGLGLAKRNALTKKATKPRAAPASKDAR
jgi:hypothetical protein